MKRFLLILSLALIMALMPAGAALADGRVNDAIWVNGLQLEAAQYWKNGATGGLVGWTFSEEEEVTSNGPFKEGASTHVILGREEDAAALLNLGVSILGAGRSCPFVDVPVNHWAYPYIFDAVKQNLINGKTADLYGPDASLTYAEAIKLAACIRQLIVDGSVTTEPGSGNPWYAPYVSYAELNSIISASTATSTVSPSAAMTLP